MKYRTLHVSKKHRFTLGFDPNSGHHFLGIPVANRMVDYIEHYRIDRSRYEEYLADEDRAVGFVAACRQRANDHLLLLKPGRDRGTPV
jgi:hypothetical protein